MLIGSYDGDCTATAPRTANSDGLVKTENYVHGTPCVVDGLAYFAGCDEKFHAVRVRDGRQIFAASATAYTGASVAMANGTAYFGTFDNQVIAFELKTQA